MASINAIFPDIKTILWEEFYGVFEQNGNIMVCMHGNHVASIPLSEVAGKLKLVTPDHDLITQGLRMGVTFGQ